MPIYDALSYCWGERSDIKEISIDDATFEVTANLHAALNCIRDPERSKLIWVDAICINQVDNEEKSQQVTIMYQIYSKARSVLIWLGEEAHGSLAAFQLIHDVLRAATLDKIIGVQHRDLWDLNEHNWDLPLTTDPIWYDLFAILQRPWFRRAWVVQELAASSSAIIMCGDETLSWTKFAEAFLYVAAGGLAMTFAPNALNNFLLLENARNASTQLLPQPALHVLMRHRQTYVSNPRDKIFAFSGLINGVDGNSLAVKPDYGSPVKDIYTNFAVETIRASQSLEVFSVPRVRDNSEIDGLPSWVPDWSVFDQAGSLPGWESHKDHEALIRPTFAATRSSKCIPILTNKCSRLGLKGAIIDRILLASPEMPTFHDQPDLVQTNDLGAVIQSQKLLNQWEIVSGCRNHWREYATGEKILDVYWQTLLAGTLFGNYEVSKNMFYRWDRTTLLFRPLQWLRLDRVWFFKTVYYIIDCICSVASFFGWQRVVDFFMITPDTWFRTLAAPMLNRRMILTENRLIGLAPKLTREDEDYVALCEGDTLPIIVRPKGSDWEFVGDCYIHGLMNGEAYDLVKHEFKTMWFV